MSKGAPNIGNKALEQDFGLLRSLLLHAPLDWLAIQTNPRCEERAALGLRAKGLVAYLPMVPDTRKAGRSKCEIDNSRPMFARYVFVGLARRDLISTAAIRTCDGVECILSYREDKAPHYVPRKQIALIAEAAQQAQLGKISVVGHGFEIGSGVVIVSGAMNFKHGVIEELNDKRGEAKVAVDAFGGTTVVTVPVDKLDLV
ncbi:transcription antitermination protein NusG [Labrenzia sp. THAF82]|uniref:transcription termination/antitermination NusG family protein n=1 Tax=Labrenzia sp. THAF82 TaxID=2587861 RepID=UPI0012679199|nr:transcription termination/antitermination NusG family protein [Labrenzia sp. THAF82]QFT31802.1 transcription antitermination protein NusG [Labrenzia sp. THAF82]